MKTGLLIIFLFCSLLNFAQRTHGRNRNRYSGPVLSASYMQWPPVFPFGPDSLQRFYFSHFEGFDSLLAKAIAWGDTAKYLRICFSYSIDENGATYDVRLERIAVSSYANSKTARTLTYFNSNKKYYEVLLKKMMRNMPFWKPGLMAAGNTGVLVPAAARVMDCIQFWVGINPPVY